MEPSSVYSPNRSWVPALTTFSLGEVRAEADGFCWITGLSTGCVAVTPRLQINMHPCGRLTFGLMPLSSLCRKMNSFTIKEGKRKRDYRIMLSSCWENLKSQNPAVELVVLLGRKELFNSVSFIMCVFNTKLHRLSIIHWALALSMRRK